MVIFPIVLSVLTWTDPPPHNTDFTNPRVVQPAFSEMCLSVTSYWVWDDNGDIYDGWRGQCDADCSTTGAGYKLPDRVEEYTDQYAACIFDWTKLRGYSTRLVTVPSIGAYKCVDNFGAPSYQQPFYHDYYEQWVIPIDLLNPFAHGLFCGWSAGWSE